MPPQPTARGLRRAELITTDVEAAVRFHERLFDWKVLQTEAGIDCWVGERRCARIRSRKAGESLGWRLVFAGAPQDGSLTGPDDTTATMTRGRAQHGPWAPKPRDGEPCWIDLAAGDVDRADAFWPDMLGWTVEDRTYATGGRPVAHRVPSGDRDGRPGWLCYIGVADLAASAGRAEELGGRVVERLPHAVLGDTVLLADPFDAVLGLVVTTAAWGS